jgi:hypothetical protein
MKTKSEAAQTANEIKKSLKERFPQTKFKVSTHIFSGSDKIKVSWENGPISACVEEIAKPLKEKGGVKYIVTERKLSDWALNITSRRLNESGWGWLEEKGITFPQWRGGQCQTNQAMHSIKSAPDDYMENWVRNEANKEEWNPPQNADQSIPLPDAIVDEEQEMEHLQTSLL